MDISYVGMYVVTVYVSSPGYQATTQNFTVNVTDVCSANNVTSAPIPSFTFDINDPPSKTLA